jgi:hypothetical protein
MGLREGGRMEIKTVGMEGLSDHRAWLQVCRTLVLDGNFYDRR